LSNAQLARANGYSEGSIERLVGRIKELGITTQPEIAVHRFGHGETQVEQRFWLGSGARRITLRFGALNAARRQALVNFFQLRQGSYEPFFLDVAMPACPCRVGGS